jgi:hypothetical protein
MTIEEKPPEPPALSVSNSPAPAQALPAAVKKERLRSLRRQNVELKEQLHSRHLTNVEFKEQLRSLRRQNEELRDALSPSHTESSQDPANFRHARRQCLGVVDQPLILVSQIQRSGGTLLSQLLDGHPECHAHPYELKWGRPAKWDWPLLDLGADATSQFEALDENWVNAFASVGLYDKAEGKSSILARRKLGQPLGDGLDPTHPFVFDRPLQLRLFRHLVVDLRPQRQRQLLDAYLTAFFGGWLDYQNQYHRPKRYVTAFTPRVQMHEESLGRFFADYPDGFLVSLVRHPAAWYASATKHDPGYSNRDTAIDLWLESTRATIAAVKQFGDRVITVIFEDLVAHTDGVMRRICDRVGLTYGDTLTRPTFNGIPMASNSHFVRSTRVDPQVNRRYRKILTDDDLATVETRALPAYEAARAKFGLAQE